MCVCVCVERERERTPCRGHCNRRPPLMIDRNCVASLVSGYTLKPSIADVTDDGGRQLRLRRDTSIYIYI